MYCNLFKCIDSYTFSRFGRKTLFVPSLHIKTEPGKYYYLLLDDNIILEAVEKPFLSKK
jgi:hypothetical protein